MTVPLSNFGVGVYLDGDNVTGKMRVGGEGEAGGARLVNTVNKHRATVGTVPLTNIGVE